jgi:cell fate regulator YaaT (PSP1 superfamily)
LRAATPEDLKHAENLRAKRNADYELARKLIMEHRLPMQLVDTERLFGGERVIFYFLAERRVDFRELVRSMAREFQSRIELRHIGIRDEARLLADYGDCGRPVCCNTFLTVMPSVTMRMAKIQKATLDPNKISGRCGRLKCCLRYEQDVYDEHLKGMPEVGMRVLTREGQGLVLYQEPLARRLLVEFEDGRRLPIPANEIISQLGFAPGYQAQTDGDI